MVFSFTRSNRVPEVFDARLFCGNASGSQLLLNERDSDVSFLVHWEGEAWRLPAHRLVLASMSDVFRKMFDTDMLERSRGTIAVHDCSPLTLRQFLRYLYVGAFDPSDGSESADLLQMAHKYGVGALVALCECHLTTSLTLANACRLYELARTYCLHRLLGMAERVVLDAAFVVCATEGFLRLGPDSLEHFLRSRFLVVENECCLLATLREWAQLKCSRSGRLLTRENVLHAMRPFFKFIRWSLIPEPLRTFVPADVVAEHSDDRGGVRRKRFHVAPSMMRHIHLLKFVVELGAFHDGAVTDSAGLNCLRFGIDNHVFVVGFRIVGMFRADSPFSAGASSLSLGRHDERRYTQFNLNSLPWSTGASVGEYVWRELTAYLPFPVRLDPFGTYVVRLKGGPAEARWPSTRLDTPDLSTPLGTIRFHCCSQCYAITQLFVLPAPPPRNVCNDTDHLP